MNIGQLRHRIEFQRLENTFDNEGFLKRNMLLFKNLGLMLMICMEKNIGIVNNNYLKI